MDVQIISNTPWGDKYGILTVAAPEFAASYRPGQFCMLSVTPHKTITDPLLRRPFAPYSINPHNGETTFIYAIVGRGTEILKGRKTGETLSLSKPAGKPFTLVRNKKVAIIAGGVGIAPMHCLAGALHKNGCEIEFYYGARSSADIHTPLKEQPQPYRWLITTEDGSLGAKGFITTLLEENIQTMDMCYTCGPKPMMMAVQQVCQTYDKPLEVSLEEVMACGIGVCSGCLVPVKTDGMASTKRCCTEGPVFNGHRVAWQ